MVTADDPFEDWSVPDRVVGGVRPAPGHHSRWLRLTTRPYWPPSAGPGHGRQPLRGRPIVATGPLARGALLMTVGTGLGLLISEIAGGAEGDAPALAAAAPAAVSLPSSPSLPSEPPAAPLLTPAPAAAYMVRPAPAAAAVTRPRAVPDPVHVTIPSLGIDRELVELGIGGDGRLEAPTTRTDIGWWSGGPAPGESGAVVVAAHVSLDGEPGVFAGLSSIQPGEDVAVTRSDGSTATYRVTTVEQFSKAAFPDDRVYSREGPTRLRLVTCGGEVDPATRHFVDNVVVFADLISDTLPPAGA